jgi:hypothetical protein
MKLEQNNDCKFDIDLAQHGRIEISRQGMHSAEYESISIDLLEKILNGKIEMKSNDKCMDTGNLFIEYQIQPKYTNEWHDSGIRTSECDYYFFNTGTGALFLELGFLKFCYDKRERFKIPFDVTNDVRVYGGVDYLGKGMLLKMGNLPFWLEFYHTECLGKTLPYPKK